MYFVFDKVFWMFSKDEDASAELLSPMPEIEPHWWDAEPIRTQFPVLTFGIDMRVPLFDNYPVSSPLNIYSSKFIGILKSVDVRFETFPISFVDVSDNKPLPYQYELFNLLEMYPAIDRSRSGKDDIALYSNILAEPKLLFRPQEMPHVMFIHEKLKIILEENLISGCLYEPLSSVRNLLV